MILTAEAIFRRLFIGAIMRLFIAVEFPDDIKDALLESAVATEKHFVYANFSRRENYHLTLAFLGETAPGRIKDVTAAMDRCGFSPFSLTIGGAGRFRRDGGDTLWRRVDAPEALFDIQARLSKELISRGFRLEERDFKPHVTVAREAVMKDGVRFSDIDFGRPLTFKTDGITLMRSDRINGKLVYTSIYKKK